MLEFQHFVKAKMIDMNVTGVVYDSKELGEDFFIEVIRANEDYTVIHYYHQCELKVVHVMKQATEEQIIDYCDNVLHRLTQEKSIIMGT